MRCCTRPGSGVEVLACTTQPTTRSREMAEAMTPPGSTLSSVSPKPAWPAQNHQGTPFMAGMTTVCGPRSGPRPRATSVRAGPLTAMTTMSCGPSAAASDSAWATGPCTRPAAVCMRQPFSRRAWSVAPRARALTSH